MMKFNRNVIISICMVVMMFVGILGNCMPVQATTEFTIRDTPPSTNNKYYYDSKYNANAGSSDYKMPNCTTYVLGRVYEITGKKFEISGNACDYYANNKKYECSTDPYAPRVGAVVCYGKRKNDDNGHVQVVEKIGEDKKGKYICVSESNYSGRKSGYGSLKFNYMKIYLEDLAESVSTKKTDRTLLEDCDGYDASDEQYQNFVYTMFQGYIYPAEIAKTSESMTLNKTSANIGIGQIIALKVTSDIPSGKKVTWKNSNDDVVVMADNGITAIVTGIGSGTSTITATCGSMTATCKVTAKGDDDKVTVKLTNDGVTKITETSARLNASISPGMIVEEAGFYYGTTKDNLKQVKESINEYAETIWYDLGTGKWCSALKPNKTYYYYLYVKVNGETYKTSISSFKTAQGVTYTLTNSEVTKLTTTSAKIKATISPGVKVEKAGFYYGKSSSNMTKKTETINAYAESVYYDLGTGKWCSALSPNTKYYYQLYVVINGTEYKSKLSSFTTAKNKIVEDADMYTSIKSADVTETSAYIRADYTKDKYDDLGFYFGTSKDLASMTKTSELKYGGTSPVTSYANSYKLGVKYDGYGYKWWEPLEPGTKYYYAFYVVLDGTEYISTIKNFTTSGSASIEDVTVTSYPTKRDYVVGEKIDTTGVKLKVTYSNGKTASITKVITVSGNASKVGTRQITLKYEGYSFKYNINVTQPLKSIKLNKSSATMDVDDVVTLSVAYNPTDTTDSKEVTWKSSNTKVVTVSNGMVIAVGGGTATITATCGEKTATCKVTVRIPVEDVSLDKTSALLTSKGAIVTLKATINPSNAANKNVTWESSDTSVAKVSKTGVVTAVGEGIATVSVTTESGNMTAVCVITVDYPDEEEPNENNSQSQKPDDEPVQNPSVDLPDISTENPNEDWSDVPIENPNEDFADAPSEEPNADFPDDPFENPNEDSTEFPTELPDEDIEYQPDETEDSQMGEESVIVENSEITSEDMETIVEANESQTIKITNEDGVVFTFTAGSMSIVEGVESYDFSTELKIDFKDAGDTQLDKNTCVLRINYTYSGELPGTATISIPVGVEWAGQQLYYYQVFDDGSYKYTGESAVVDALGNYTIRQSHCSDYIISTLPPVGRDDEDKTHIYYVLFTVAIIAATGVGIGVGVFLNKKKYTK